MTLRGYRTFIFNAVASVPLLIDQALPVLLPILGAPEVQAVIPADWLHWYALALVVGNAYLRTITSTPAGRASPNAPS